MQESSKENRELFYQAVLSLKNKEECEAFFEDVCTQAEIDALSQRVQVAKMLDEKNIYTNISKATGASSATISRVNRTFTSKHSGNGLRLVIKRLEGTTKRSDTSRANNGAEND